MLTKWRPFQDVARFNRELDCFFRAGGGNGEPNTFAPAVDIEETEQAVVLCADLPGVEEKDIEVTVHQGVLVLTGKREDHREETTESGFYRERRYGSFFRRFRLGDKVDPEGIVAAFKNGVLTVTLPKKEEAKPKQIPVATA
jgi:HSP20 family protein